jgi:two-component sensor histidine kinase
MRFLGIIALLVRAVSIFDMIVLLWLGSTIALYAERRKPGTWIAATGALLAGCFFAAHSILVSGTLTLDSEILAPWWHIMWLALIIWPLNWLSVIIWFTEHLRRRQWQLILSALLVFGIPACLIPLIGETLPSLDQVIDKPMNIPGTLPFFLLSYPIYGILCQTLAIIALRQASTTSWIQQGVNRYVHPWLVRASWALLGIAISTCLVALSFFALAKRGSIEQDNIAYLLGWCDLIIASLIGIAAVLVGEAILGYEVLTDRPLPRQQMARQWYMAVYLAACVSVGVAGLQSLDLPPLAIAVIICALLTIGAALLVERVNSEAEARMDVLRPFIGSEGVFEQALLEKEKGSTNLLDLLAVLCNSLAPTDYACIIPVDELAALLSTSIIYPAHHPLPDITSAIATARHALEEDKRSIAFRESETLAVNGWIIPLKQGTTIRGVLMLGNPRRDVIYTEEEIEIASAVGLRVLDTLVSRAIATQLLQAQRQQIVASQYADHQSRRIIHDEILPDLQASLVRFSTTPASQSVEGHKMIASLTTIHQQLATVLRTMPQAQHARIHAGDVLTALHELVEHEMADAFSEVTWQIEPTSATILGKLPDLTGEIIFSAAREACRNAARYGAKDANQPPCITISAETGENVIITISDNGAGIASNGSRSQGTGQGLALHSTLLAILGGALIVTSAPEKGTSVTISVPHVATTRG